MEIYNSKQLGWQEKILIFLITASISGRKVIFILSAFFVVETAINSGKNIVAFMECLEKSVYRTWLFFSLIFRF